MKIIPPYKISSEILEVIHEAQEYLILVSPYVDFTNWEGMKKAIQSALTRNVKIKFYVRFEDKNFKSWEQIEAFGIVPKLVKNLHTKLYFSEKVGIVTSMNLLTSSNLNAIEFGSVYNTAEEMNELKSYVKKYLEPHIEAEKPNEDDLYIAKEKFQILLENFLSNILESRVNCRWQKGTLLINANNTYYLSLDKVRNTLDISGIVSGLEGEQFRMFCANSTLNNCDIFCGGSGDSISSFSATSKQSYSNSNFDFLMVKEKKEILDYTLQFIQEMKAFKKYCYENRNILKT
jgi:hypothetical protein